MPPPTLNIRAADPGDVALISHFIVELARFEKLDHEVDTEGAEARLREHLFGSRPACEVLIAEDAGTPVGFALFFPVYSTFKTEVCLHLEDLFVEPAARGRGIGEALLRSVAGVAHERGCARLQWNVLDWNAGAIGFYERLGATLLSDWRTCRVEGGDAIRRLSGE